MNEAWIALGSNLGRRAETLAAAIGRLEDLGLEPVKVSHLYETRPEGGAAEPPYLNAVLKGRTGLGPEELLDAMLRVEDELGRPAQHSAGPRTCDLDLLSFADLVVEQGEGLQLPHPRLHRRSFVLVPLCELDVHWRHPVLGATAGDLLAALPTSPGEVRLHGSLPRGAPAAARTGPEGPAGGSAAGRPCP